MTTTDKGASAARSLLLAGFCTIAFAGAPAGAADGEKSANGPAERSSGKPFAALDTNRDGSLSRPEVAAHPEIAEKFKDADRDNDRKLSRSEYEAHYGAGEPLSGAGATAGEKRKP